MAGFSAVTSALNMLPGTAYRVARRVVKDIGGKDVKLANAALKMVGYHAAAGAALGGVYSSYNGGSFARGAMIGGATGAGFGMMGGTGMVRNISQRAYGMGARKDFNSMLLSQMSSGGKHTLSDSARLEARRLTRSAQTSGLINMNMPGFTGRGMAGRANNFMMGGYNPFGASGSSVISAGKKVGFSGRGGFSIAQRRNSNGQFAKKVGRGQR